MRFNDITDCLKVVLVAEADRELQKTQGSSNISRISVMTGLQRKEARSLRDTDEIRAEGRDMITKVMGLWQTHPDFITKAGSPRVLSMNEGKPSFSDLVKQVSTDVNPVSVLAELQRVKAIKETRGGIMLLKASFTPKDDPEKIFNIVSADLNDLLSAAEQNIFGEDSLPNLHARTEYDKVRPEGLAELKEWFLREGHQFHAKVREIVSRHDQDINPVKDFSGDYARVVVGAFSYTDNDGEAS